jgi:hypothetical protein
MDRKLKEKDCYVEMTSEQEKRYKEEVEEMQPLNPPRDQEEYVDKNGKLFIKRY